MNEDYFREQGLEDLLEPKPEKETPQEVEINVDLDAEYFKWKEEE